VSGSHPAGDDVSIVVGGQAISGWESVRITRGIERCPSDFDLGFTERYPKQSSDIVIVPGSPAQVRIGGDLVVTGYADRYAPAISARQHQVRVSGRSKCEDLVDSSAIFQTYQINNTTIASLAKQLCDPFGIAVSAPNGDSGVIPQFNVVLTETPYEILERVARYAAKLVYDGTDGNLIIADVGTATMASGFVQGVNVEAASATFAMDQRYTSIAPIFFSTSVLTNGVANGQADIPYIPNSSAVDNTWPKRADGKPRYRPLLIISEQAASNLDFAKNRAAWEMARRIGRSQAVRVTCDSWRDSAGTLWAPNTFASVYLPALKVTPKEKWIIGEVSLVRDDRGQHAELLLMPKEAFVPEPIVLQPAPYQVLQALQDAGGANNSGANASGNLTGRGAS
jgi:prophage tail gpP-like protein